MSKFWSPGQVKTRLGCSIGDQQSAAIHRQFVIHLAESLAAVGDRRVFAVTPTDRIDEFRAALPTDRWETKPQSEGNLGRRMAAWFQDCLAAKGPRQIASVLIGSDCPSLNPDQIESAFHSLASHDVVLGPARDGGYYLIGLRGPWREPYARLFQDIPWSEENVYQLTRQRIDEGKLQLATLPMREDIDTISELNRLREQLATSCHTRGRDLLIAIESILDESQR